MAERHERLRVQQEWKATALQSREEIFEQLDRIEGGEVDAEAREALFEQIDGRLMQMRHERDQLFGYIAEESALIDEIETRVKELRRQQPGRFHIVPPAPTNGQIDSEERRRDHFAQGKSAYKIFWMFFVGSILGVLVERVWCVVRYGFYEPRVGSIYGPFNPVYGLAAAALTLTLYGLRNRGRILSFLGGAIVGSAVEYACSFVQELVFGSASWDYSNRPFNINGRICLLYSVYWGVLGMLYIKEFYPRIAKLILKIPNKVGKPLTVALALFMTVNVLMTGMALLRWSERRDGSAPSSMLEEYFDKYYPDEKMKSIFTNLEFVDERDARRERQNAAMQAAKEQLDMGAEPEATPEQTPPAPDAEN